MVRKNYKLLTKYGNIYGSKYSSSDAGGTDL